MAVMQNVPLQERANGRWHSILPALGIPAEFLKRKNGPCPMCGGTDRWRFTDIEGTGTWWCNNCRGGAGVALVMKFIGLPFREAAARIEQVLGDAVPRRIDTTRSEADRRAALNSLWCGGRDVVVGDAADLWLNGRGVGMQSFPRCLRTGTRVRHSGAPVAWYPAMLAMVSDINGRPATIHKTYLAPDGTKAPVDKVRMFCPGSRPLGGAVRLAPATDVLGIAEGIETALAATKLFGIPTWSALDAGGVERFEPPPETARLVIFGDHDTNGTGQRATYALAARMAGRLKVEPRIPDQPDTDWNDVLRAC